jgi:hypothetical protein
VVATTASVGTQRVPSRRLSRPGTAWKVRRERQGNAAATRDMFMDIIVLISVLMFIALACGVGMLVLEASNPGWLAR